MKRLELAPPARDRYGRPVIDGEPYTRASTLAKTLDDQSNLIRWSSRMTAVGMSRSQDLVALASTMDPDNRKGLDEVVDRAKDRAGAGTGRDLGTSIHAATELVDYGMDLGRLPLDIRNDAEGYEDACRANGLTPVAGELFVVNSGLRAAGTFDRLMVDENGNGVVWDTKTGSNTDPKKAAQYAALAWSMQLATYATATPYDGLWGLRSWEELGLPVPSSTRGFIGYIPRGSGRCHVIEIDLALGLAAARLAVQVRDIRKSKTVRSVVEAKA